MSTYNHTKYLRDLVKLDQTLKLQKVWTQPASHLTAHARTQSKEPATVAPWTRTVCQRKAFGHGMSGTQTQPIEERFHQVHARGARRSLKYHGSGARCGQTASWSTRLLQCRPSSPPYPPISQHALGGQPGVRPRASNRPLATTVWCGLSGKRATCRRKPQCSCRGLNRLGRPQFGRSRRFWHHRSARHLGQPFSLGRHDCFSTTWNPRERVIIRGMEDYPGRSEDIMMEVGELETYLLGPSDVAGIIVVLAKKLSSSRGVKAMWWQPRDGMRLCKRARTEVTGSCRRPSST